MLNWVEIDADAIRHNLRAFRGLLTDKTALGAVVKSNAYGHGMEAVAAVALEAGADWLCVNSLDEALPLAAAHPDVPILVMGYIPLDRLDAIPGTAIRPVVYNVETIERLEQLGAEHQTAIPLHLKVETGTHRQGVMEHELDRYAELFRNNRWATLEGISMHFANIEDTTRHDVAEAQIEAFDRVHQRLIDAGAPPKMRHSACSAAMLLFTRTHLDLTRVGIAMYGLWPSKETLLSSHERGRKPIELEPALTWKTRIAQIKQVPEGALVGYGCSWKATRASRLAILPVGYAEGYDRALSGVAHVLVRGRRAPVRGRICMNITIIDVTDIPDAALEDEVVLLGSQGDERLSAEELADWAGTISYEIVARIHPGLPRLI